ncbi:MMPL family transporter [Streptantibioticus rubrisoli]|uniref:MMPL family transporter n=1 Tax=Streptantibioticus rubrisoli TaxID=1387313 RepID=A0ABT1P8G7_9ACTN|nr:MMPL family transporter [Streptantibioticus rubrisoli]MCQ4041662.1 MMPL family transporter [Streptantibioticus rubrisoli]
MTQQGPRQRAWWIILCAALVGVAAVLLAPLAFGALSTGGAVATGTEAERARQRAEQLGVPAPDLVLALPHRPEEATRVVRALAREPDVRAVWSAGTTGDPWLRSRDGRTELVEVRLRGTDKDRKHAAPQVVAAARSAVPRLKVAASGEAWADRTVDETVERDLRRAEVLAAPALFVILVLAYGSLVSAALPVLVAGLAVGCTLPVLGLLARAVDMPRPAVNAASAIGLGLAVDYSLFLLARVREETARGMGLEAALAAARRSSGRSVVFSAGAITACLAPVLLVPVPLLRALSMAGMVVTVLAAVIALTVLPACLLLLGPRAGAWDPLARWRRTRTGEPSRFWRRTAQAVTARPVWAGGLVVVLLVLLAAPFSQVRLGVVDDRTLPPTTAAAAAAERVRTEFAAPPDRLLTVVVTGPDATAGAAAYADRLHALAGVAAVHIARTLPAQQAAVLLVVAPAAPGTRASDDAVRAVRNTPAPGDAAVGGRAAAVTDTADAVVGALPWCLTSLGVGLALLLGLFTRSVVAPLKALAVAAVSLGASLGALVLIFQEGHGRTLLGGFTVTHVLDVSTLLFVLLITLALSVDYEVFLLGRIREEYLRCGDNRTAIVDGIARTGRLMTSAALAVALSTAAMGTSDVALLKLIGIGVALGALVDAAFVRGVLVPAVMSALGPANWWAPSIRIPAARQLTARPEKTKRDPWGNACHTPPPQLHPATHHRPKARRPLHGSRPSGRRSRPTTTPSTKSWPRWRAPPS